MSRVQADLLLILAALIWGVAFYFQKTAMTHVGPMLFLGLRASVAAAALTPFAAFERPKREDGAKSIFPIALIGGLVFLIAAYVQQRGIVTATVINSGFLTSLYVIATPFLLWIVYRRPPPSKIWLAVFLSFFGAWTLAGGTIGGMSNGDWLIGLSAIIWAVHLVVTGASTKFGQPLRYTCIQFVIVAICALTLATLFEPISLANIILAWKSVLFVGLLSSALTFSILAIALRQTTASEAAVLMSLDTIFAAMAGYVLLGERLAPVGWLGAAMMFAAVVIVQVRRDAP